MIALKGLESDAQGIASPSAFEEPSSKPRAALVDRAGALGRCEMLVTVLLAFVAAALHFRFANEVGALWRDEVNTVNFANLPSFGEMWRLLEYDSFPIVFATVVRCFTAIFGADNDYALRMLGLLTGFGILAALWSNARAFGARVPILSFALIGLNPMMIRYGDSTRAYGLGILLILLTFRSFWKLVEQPAPPSLKRILAATILAVLSVQCLYYNSVLLLAIATGAVAVALRARSWRTAGIIIGIGAVAAISLLPYVPIFVRMREWTFLVNYPASFAWLGKRACEVMGSPNHVGVWLWVGLVGVGLATSVVAGARGFLKNLPAPILFAAVALVVGVIGYASFLRMLNYYTQPWYYITLAAFVACALEILFGAWPNRRGLILRSLRPLVAVALLCFAPLAWKEMAVRHTNVDLVAGQIQGLAKEGDVVLLPRWECAISFNRYYHGKGEVVTLPPISDHRFHRYDLVLAQMRTDNAQQPVIDKMEQTLRSGHRVFFADTLPFANADVKLPILRPPYQDSQGTWHGGPYNAVWQVYAARFLRDHCVRVGKIEVSLPPGGKVQEFEELTPGVVEGWK